KTNISMITAYDFPTAKQAQDANIYMILFGDSLGMTVLGYEKTTQVTLEDMIHNGKSVRRGDDDTFVVVDLQIGAFVV
ncbi:3-methyl-2-oxobutanoate hydroxymethyltransferase, partial [Staphylococcus haemolyticus]|uniref:3-methyl-2-oxobutanoate hydroxymethyltransferase n=1 Tax=Staphylococcus haemolyticus TaxID=1283 RepID=UPI003B818903